MKIGWLDLLVLGSYMGAVVLVGLWAIAMGGIELAAAKKLRKFVRREWLLVAAAVVSVTFGALLLSSPSRVAPALVPLLAAYGVVGGEWD